MTAYAIKLKSGAPRGLVIDGVELKMVERVTVEHVPDALRRIVVTIFMLPEDTFEYQDADQA